MTRTVFDNAMTAHVWASQSQEKGRSNNGNFYFKGRCLYSYGPHFICGFAAPGGLWLLNGDDSSMTTKGKHMKAARRAVDYGRGQFANCYTVPGLTQLVDTWRPRYGQRDSYTGPETVRRLAKHMESACGAFWPGAEAAAAIYRAAGASAAEAERRGRAGADRVARAIAKAEAEVARRELESQARMARGHFTRTAPAETAGDVREKLAEAADAGSQWREDSLLAEAVEIGREAHRAAKAAKAKGWPRIAARCRAHHKAARAEIARFEVQRERYKMRAAISAAIGQIRTAPDQIRQFWELNPEAREGAAVTDHGRAVRACETGARGMAELAAALGRVADSPFAGHVWPGPVMLAARAKAQTARDTAESLRIRAGNLRTEGQAEARAEWLAGGNPATYLVGRLCDARGAALLRAEGVQRDESGAIVGGTLRTSWGAAVPLVHAIRAFRFLRHCRDTGTEWRANGRTLRVGHFRVDHVDSDGNFVAGCHRISWAEAARVAEGLGLAKLAGADTTESSRGAA